VDKLNELGDVAMDSAAHNDAAAYYSSVLTIDPLSTDALIKRSKAHGAMDDWEAALKDANDVCVVWAFIPRLANDMHLRQSRLIRHTLGAMSGNTQRSMVLVVTTKQSKH
jgi:hypothetical protein